MTPLAVGRLASDGRGVVDALEGAVGRRGEAALEGAFRVAAAAGEAADAVEMPPVPVGDLGVLQPVPALHALGGIPTNVTTRLTGLTRLARRHVSLVLAVLLVRLPAEPGPAAGFGLGLDPRQHPEV